MQESLKKFSPAVFGIILICFLLPWVNLTCQGQNAATFSGLELVTGTTVQQQNQTVKSEPLAVAVLVLTILGLALSFLKDKKSSIIPGIIGVAAFILLLLLKSKIDASNQSIQVQYAIGFWLVLVLLIGAIALNGYLYFYSKKQV
jgi:lipopolysaccharide export LptBFGC system permease protein LptF